MRISSAACPVFLSLVLVGIPEHRRLADLVDPAVADSITAVKAPGPCIGSCCRADEVVVCIDPISADDPRFPFAAPVDPISAVREMMGAIARRSESEYVDWLTEDFVFESDDPSFRLDHPSGTSREDERVWAAHLFHGGGRAPDGRPLPWAAHIDTIVGPVTGGANGGQARIVLDDPHLLVRLSNGMTIDLGGSRSVLDLVWNADRWRVRHWSETGTASIGEDDSLAYHIASDGEPPRRDIVDVAPRLGLSLVAHADRAHGALVLDLVLPHTGGTLELFDVQGRRVGSRDLAPMRPGRHRVVIDGAPYSPGVYFIRLRQDEESRTVKLVWSR